MKIHLFIHNAFRLYNRDIIRWKLGTILSIYSINNNKTTSLFPIQAFELCFKVPNPQAFSFFQNLNPRVEHFFYAKNGHIWNTVAWSIEMVSNCIFLPCPHWCFMFWKMFFDRSSGLTNVNLLAFFALDTVNHIFGGAVHWSI